MNCKSILFSVTLAIDLLVQHAAFAIAGYFIWSSPLFLSTHRHVYTTSAELPNTPSD